MDINDQKLKIILEAQRLEYQRLFRIFAQDVILSLKNLAENITQTQTQLKK